MVSNLRVISDEEKYVLDKYTDIIKLRAAQVLALFVAYAFALRSSSEFLDGPSVLALVIPIAAWIFDLVARRHYMCPYAYAAAAYSYANADSKTADSVASGVPNLVIDYTIGPSSKAIRFFQEEGDEMERRRKFRNWFTFKDQTVPAIIFSGFFFLALLSTVVLKPKETPDDQTAAVSRLVMENLSYWLA